jgi:hypothetical protein
MVYQDLTRQAKELYRLKHDGALKRGLAYLSRYNSSWFCHNGKVRGGAVVDREELWWSAHGEQRGHQRRTRAATVDSKLIVECECQREQNGGRGSY